jgi:hypothetical protein
MPPPTTVVGLLTSPANSPKQSRFSTSRGNFAPKSLVNSKTKSEWGDIPQASRVLQFTLTRTPTAL